MTSAFPPPRDPLSTIPPASVASPSQVRHGDQEAPRWYLPTFTQRLAMLQWRVLWFLPAVFLIMLMAMLPFAPWMLGFMMIWWKLLMIAVFVPLSYAMRIMSRAMAMKKNPFCIHCGYDLTGLPDGHTCPECGAVFHFTTIDEYRRDPHWFIKRHGLGKTIPPRDEPFQAGPNRSAGDGT